MEKQRTKSGSKFSRRLLAAIVFVNFLSPLYAKILTNSDFAKLRFVPVQSNNDSIGFSSSGRRKRFSCFRFQFIFGQYLGAVAKLN